MSDGTIMTCGSNKHGQQGEIKKEKDEKDDDKGGGGEKKDESSDEEQKGYGSQGEAKGVEELIPAHLKRKLADLKKQKDVFKPKPIQIFYDGLVMKVRYVAAGYYHVLAVTSEGLTFGWGRNDNGQVGVGRKEVSIMKPEKIKSLQEKKIVMTAAGENHSLFLTELGDVFSCGYNEYGELGIGMEPLMGKEREQDEPVDIIYERAQIETKIELTPKLVQGLEQIGMIAAGKNHSIAIRTHKTKERDLEMYSWGCGWQGQLGHYDFQNQYCPRRVRTQLKNTKFVQASCGAKHTLALDTYGCIWFMGSKPSVGIVQMHANQNTKGGVDCFEEEKQSNITRLQTALITEQVFKYVASGEEHNLAISTLGQVYGFGRNRFSKIKIDEEDVIQFDFVDMENKCKLVACGSNHSALTDLKSIPYTWGLISNGRCGQKIKSTNPMDNTRQLFKPTPIHKFVSLRTQQQKQPINLEKQNQQEEMKDEEVANIQSQTMFPIQKILKENQNSLDEQTLISQDQSLAYNFRRLVFEFHELLRSKQDKLNDQFYNAQNSIISRIYTFPQKMEMLADIKQELPKVIIKNKQYYEMIFTLLQNHPCYIINWITKTPLHRQPSEVEQILKVVYGEKEMRNDKRILHCLMNLALKVFQFEMKTYDLKEILSNRNESAFITIFKLILQNQDDNNDYINGLISSLLVKLQKYIRKVVKNNSHLEQFNEANLQSLFDYEAVIQENKKAHFKIKLLIEFMKKCLKKMLKSIDPHFKQSGGFQLSDEIFSMIYMIKNEIESKQTKEISKEDVDSYIIYLIFSTMIERMEELNFDKIADFYWYVNEKERGKIRRIETGQGDQEDIEKGEHSSSAKASEPDPNIFNFQEKKNLISILAAHLKRYLKKTKIQLMNQPPPVENLNNFIEFVGQSRKDVNFREKLSAQLNFSPLNVEYLLISDLFQNSMEHKNPRLTIQVKDLISIYNNLIEKSYVILIPFDRKDLRGVNEVDPIQELISELGGQPIQLNRDVRKFRQGGVDFRKNDKQLISDDMLELRLNLEIKSRVLIDKDEITKCADCNGPIYAPLVPTKRLKEAVDDRMWKCACNQNNNQNTVVCSKCRQGRDDSTFPKDQLFFKYKPSITDRNVYTFQRILLYLPIIDAHQNFEKILNHELETEKLKKVVDYEKLKTIEEFNKYLTSEKFSNKKLNPNYENNQDAIAMMAVLEAQMETLQKLAQQLENNHKLMQQHEQRLKRMRSFMQDIRDKIGTFNQVNKQLRSEFKIIAANAFTGCGSQFLQDQKEDILAGKLHLKGGKAKQVQQAKQNPQLDQFFNQLDQATQQNPAYMEMNYQEVVQNRDVFRSNFGFFGKYPIYVLRQRKVLNNIEIHGKKLQTVMKKCSYIFYDDGQNGFKVELVYEEANRRCLVFGQNTHEAIIEKFNISKDEVAEMRRTFSTKASKQFENAEFNVFELVILLNEIKSKTYHYGIGVGEKKKKKKKVEEGFMKQEAVQQEDPKKDKKNAKAQKAKEAKGKDEKGNQPTKEDKDNKV